MVDRPHAGHRPQPAAHRRLRARAPAGRADGGRHLRGRRPGSPLLDRGVRPFRQRHARPHRRGGPADRLTAGVVDPDVEETVDVARPWVVVVWNDPINLMSYVVYVFQKLFGYSREKATKLMLDVHHKGKAAVSSGNREQAETDVSRLHAHGLWATMERD
ncbi:MAG: ATP-dependent Clp protease adapter ClpS [Actinobacteria bacterium]|nr:MAG: ATP-dependent Clp protease adapter ClpS [Actinomycetota bacterium]